MSISALRLFVDAPLGNGATVALSADQAHYVSRVMRRNIGDPLSFFNGTDGEWSAEIIELGKKSVTAKALEQTRSQHFAPDLWLLFAPVKRAPIDQIAQKATELGVSALIPVKSDRTIVTRVNEERLRANAIEAAEQCERLDVPEVRELQPLQKILREWPQKAPGRNLIFCDEAGDNPDEKWGGTRGRAEPVHQALAELVDSKSSPWAILIGPEGGFTPAERELIRTHDFAIPVSLGPRILRADTAAFAAITLWQSVFGDFSKS